jgi:hypothetical protein
MTQEASTANCRLELIFQIRFGRQAVDSYDFASGLTVQKRAD